MVDIPVDDHKSLQDIADEISSVGDVTGAKPIILFDQDKGMYNQNSSNSMQ